jgi:hypothetical protein
MTMVLAITFISGASAKVVAVFAKVVVAFSLYWIKVCDFDPI